ncbi:hypothetical protein ATX71_09875 [Oenococcus oeni]|uniref:hypothetical protein n=1 Tax=Oenococcus oeni TaxID=1247 RepID=UPI0008F8A3E0|nr:hypothetical protein [Oenococcus oeni]OIL54563.1 hypothetical protein ATX21_09625 [Oenococcus oeni]OIL57897.1 hypothetical protein ATX22_02495 [Oenococcus oeni]OIM35852.1 hypothetical protein ATX71_09875 [Oenococcus oeni]OIM83037.1 hypothetical protein ATX99_09585 [Oenococcus oeni]
MTTKSTDNLSKRQREYLKALNKIRNSYPVTPDEAEFYVTKCLMLFGDLSPEHLQTVLKDLNAKMAGISEDKK